MVEFFAEISNFAGSNSLKKSIENNPDLRPYIVKDPDNDQNRWFDRMLKSEKEDARFTSRVEFIARWEWKLNKKSISLQHEMCRWGERVNEGMKNLLQKNANTVWKKGLMLFIGFLFRWDDNVKVNRLCKMTLRTILSLLINVINYIETKFEYKTFFVQFPHFPSTKKYVNIEIFRNNVRVPRLTELKYFLLMLRRGAKTREPSLLKFFSRRRNVHISNCNCTESRRQKWSKNNSSIVKRIRNVGWFFFFSIVRYYIFQNT